MATYIPYSEVYLFIESNTTDGDLNIIDQATTFPKFIRKTTVVVEPQHKTDQKKFGTSSLFLTGGSYIRAEPTDSADYDLGNDWSVSFWVRKDETSFDSTTLISMGGSYSAFWINVNSQSEVTAYIRYSTGYYWTLASNTRLQDNTWHHIALVRTGAGASLYIDGVYVAYASIVGVYDTKHEYTIKGGDNNCWLDNIIVTNTALWNDDFTPPTEPFKIGDPPPIYENVPGFGNQLIELYSDVTNVSNVLQELYGNMGGFGNYLEEVYNLNSVASNTLEEVYHLMNDKVSSNLNELYDLQETFRVGSSLVEMYNLLSAGTVLLSSLIAPYYYSGTEKVYIQTSGVRLNFNENLYCGSMSFDLVNTGDKSIFNSGLEVYADYLGITFKFLYFETTENERSGSKVVSINVKSPAFTLDFPYSSKIPNDDLVQGKASQICNSICAIKGIDFIWDMTVDPIVTDREITLANKSPLNGLREIVNTLRGVLQSDPDGTLRAVPKYIEDVHEYNNSTYSYSFDIATDFEEINTKLEVTEGFNVYFISNYVASDSITLNAEEKAPHHFELQAYVVPFNGNLHLDLSWSEKKGVDVTNNGYITRQLTQKDVEIVSGEGKLSTPCLDIVSYTYKPTSFTDRVDLGQITPYEDGTIHTAIPGNSLVDVTYTTKYYSWDAYDLDPEKVQFILESEEIA